MGPGRLPSIWLAGTLFTACADTGSDPSTSGPQSATCELVANGHGSAGSVAVSAETVVSGLEVPWGIAFISADEWLVTERPGRVRLVRAGALEAEPVATVQASEAGEGGLLGIALHPDFSVNSLFFLYVTVAAGGATRNQVELWRLSADHGSASREQIVIDQIPGAAFHDGGRLRIGPDGMLYVGTGDARSPDLSQDEGSPAGKVLRLTLDGAVPADNPTAGEAFYVSGVRNVQAFDWRDDGALVIADHGPSGELGRSGHDEVSVARAGDNLGWPTIYGCQSRSGMVSPSLTWAEAAPPGGAAFYRGSQIPEWQGSFLVGTLGSRHLHRVVFESPESAQVAEHEVYFDGELGRLREVVMGPDGELYVTTSNCDGRGTCAPERDRIVRITR